MLTFAYLWIFALLPLPLLLQRILPPRRRSEVAVRVPFGARLQAAMAAGMGASTMARKTSRQLVPALIWILLLTRKVNVFGRYQNPSPGKSRLPPTTQSHPIAPSIFNI